MKAPLSKDKGDIARMFDSIAPKYDLLNHLLSFNIDRPWRKRMVKEVKKSGADLVLDMACGTGDVSMLLFQKGISVVGMDISQNMLDRAKAKSEQYLSSSHPTLRYEYGAADSIGYPDNTFDATVAAFGVRNFDHRALCITEMYRTIKRGGSLFVLEFATPENRVWRSIYSLYFGKILPKIGGAISGKREAYEYLHTSAIEFPQREEFCKELEQGGFSEVSYRNLTGGVACLYRGRKVVNARTVKGSGK